MDLFNTKKITELELENTLLQKKVSELVKDVQTLEYKIGCYDTALKAFNKYITSEVDVIKKYLDTEGRKKTIDGVKVSCFKMFLDNQEDKNV